MTVYYGNGLGLGPRVLSRPIPVRFQGWRSTTAELQQAGWELATQYTVHEDMYQLAVSNPQLQLVGRTTQPINIPRDLQYRSDRGDLPTFDVSYVAHRVKVFEHREVHFPTVWHRIDATPQLATDEVRDLHDLCHFAPYDKSRELMVAAADMEVVELLDAIMRKQQPKQQELREKLVKSSKIERTHRILEVA